MRQSRRSFCRLGVAAASSALSLPSLLAKDVGRDDWLEQLLRQQAGASAAVEGALRLGRFRDPIYFLLRSITWTAERGSRLPARVEAPAGFVTDLASIPREFFSLLRPDGDYAYAAILHDYLYWTQTTDRVTADMVFRAAMEEFGVARATTQVIFTAVRLAGEDAWNTNAQLKKSGEKRVLRKYPDDPRTTWATWKTQPGTLF
jgi:Protein of unknown function (DUF1353)